MLPVEKSRKAYLELLKNFALKKYQDKKCLQCVLYRIPAPSVRQPFLCAPQLLFSEGGFSALSGTTDRWELGQGVKAELE